MCALKRIKEQENTNHKKTNELLHIYKIDGTIEFNCWPLASNNTILVGKQTFCKKIKMHFARTTTTTAFKTDSDIV